MYQYDIYQFRVHSELPLPCDSGAHNEDTLAGDVVIRRARQALEEFRQVLFTGRFEEGLYRAYDTGDGVLFCADNYLKMHVDRAGKVITLEFSDQHLGAAGLYAIGMGLAICIHFRDGLALHAASADICGKRVAIMAPSGTGKSTLLWALQAQGSFANDDLVPVIVKVGSSIAEPSRSLHMRLSEEAVAALAVSPDRLRYDIGDGKWLVGIPNDRRTHDARPLCALFWLNPSLGQSSSNQVTLSREAGAKAVSRILDNLYAMGAIASQIDSPKLMLRIMTLLRTVPLYTLCYKKQFDVLPVLVKTITDVVTGIHAGAQA